MHGHNPVKNFDGGRNGDEKGQKGKNYTGVDGLAADKKMMAPDEETDYGDGQTGIGDESISVYAALAETGYQLADDAHTRQNHDVHGGMRIEPEKMLEQNGIATQGWIEKTKMKRSLNEDHNQRDGNNGCS